MRWIFSGDVWFTCCMQHVAPKRHLGLGTHTCDKHWLGISRLSPSHFICLCKIGQCAGLRGNCCGDWYRDWLSWQCVRLSWNRPARLRPSLFSMSCVTHCVVLACDDSIVEPGKETGAWLDGLSLSGITAEYKFEENGTNQSHQVYYYCR